MLDFRFSESAIMLRYKKLLFRLENNLEILLNTLEITGDIQFPYVHDDRTDLISHYIVTINKVKRISKNNCKQFGIDIRFFEEQANKLEEFYERKLS